MCLRCPLDQAAQALVRKHEEAYLESEEQGDREFWVAFYNKPQTLPLRQLKTGAIGQLTCFKVQDDGRVQLSWAPAKEYRPG